MGGSITAEHGEKRLRLKPTIRQDTQTFLDKAQYFWTGNGHFAWGYGWTLGGADRFLMRFRGFLGYPGMGRLGQAAASTKGAAIYAHDQGGRITSDVLSMRFS